MSNWIILEIKGKKYHLLCKIDERNNWDSLLYDGNESWYEQSTQEIVLARVKEQNKRIQFDEASIKETLQGAQPTEATWLDNNSDDEDARSLKLKYSVKSCPFHFTWHFSKQSEHDFQKFILFPLFRIVQGLTQQNEELRDVIRKKDIEIKQYKYEFGLLKRVTVSTQPFNVSEFDGRYAETLELSKCMMQISDLLKAQYSQMKTPLKAKATDKANDDTAAAKRNEETKLTPRRKRRKLLEEKQRIIAEKMQAMQKPFQYESSQSQISSISASDTEAPSTSRRLLRSPRKTTELTIESDLDETPTKRNRPQAPTAEQPPVKSVKRSLEYENSSDDSAKIRLSPIKHLSPTKVAEKTNELGANSPSTRSRASVAASPIKFPTAATDKASSATAASIVTRKNACIYDYNESSDDGSISAKSTNKSLSQTVAKSQASKSSPTCSKPTILTDHKSTAKLTKGSLASTAALSTKSTRKNAGIAYEDSSESPTEEQFSRKLSTSLNATPTKDSSSKITQSPEQLLDDVQHLIDEWKALEKRRLADLKKSQK